MRRRTTKKQLHPKSLDACVKAVAYPLGGVDCYLWFDEDGELHGTGPKEARRNLESFLLRYTPLMKSKKVIDCIAEHKPMKSRDLWIQRFAVLALMLEVEARGDRPEDAVLAKKMVERFMVKIRELPNFGEAEILH